MRSDAKTAAEYLASLPPERQKVMSTLRQVLKRNLPKGFKEVMNYGMIGYVVPLNIYRDGYHCNPEQPLPFISLASQKNYISVYHMGLYKGALLDWFLKEWKKHSSKKADLGKCCIRFRKPEDIPIALLADLAQQMTPAQWISHYELSMRTQNKRS